MALSRATQKFQQKVHLLPVAWVATTTTTTTPFKTSLLLKQGLGTSKNEKQYRKYFQRNHQTSTVYLDLLDMRKTPAFWQGFVGGEVRQKFYTQYRKIQVYAPENDWGHFLRIPRNFVKPELPPFSARCLHRSLGKEGSWWLKHSSTGRLVQWFITTWDV